LPEYSRCAGVHDYRQINDTDGLVVHIAIRSGRFDLADCAERAAATQTRRMTLERPYLPFTPGAVASPRRVLLHQALFDVD